MQLIEMGSLRRRPTQTAGRRDKIAMSKEDKLVNSAIEYHKEDKTETQTLDVTPEAPYNYYGNRGVADLFVRQAELVNNAIIKTKVNYDYLYEMKGGAAIRNATGANEIIRQFNRMRKYFYKDENRTTPQTAHIELCFVIEPQTVEHVARNFQMYKSIAEDDLCEEVKDPSSVLSAETVTFRRVGYSGGPLRFDLIDAATFNEFVSRCGEKYGNDNVTVNCLLGVLEDVDEF